MENNTPSIPPDRLSGSKTQYMIGLSKLVANKGSAQLMAMLCHSLAEVVSCISLSLVRPLIKIWRGTQLSTLQGPMNGILQSWNTPIHLVMGSLLDPMTLMRDLPLILTLMSLGITPKGQYKLSVFWMTHHPL